MGWKYFEIKCAGCNEIFKTKLPENGMFPMERRCPKCKTMNYIHYF